MAELKFVITGTAGVGKTTAICSVSDIPPVSTDAATTDALAQVKSTTTTAFDFGEIIVDELTTVRLYGTPGQERFKHMWEIIATGALGLIILVDNSKNDPVKDLETYLHNFHGLINQTGVVVGVTRIACEEDVELEKYYDCLAEKEIYCPVMAVDPRIKADVVALLDILMSLLEAADS